MADLTLRLVKGSPLTNAEVDGNFTSLNESIMVTGEPMGHANKSDSVLSFNAGTRTVSIAPAVTSFAVWCKGTKYTYTTAQTVVIPDTTGLHYVFFTDAGVLSTRMSYFDFENEAPTSYVAWNSVTQQASFFADERHGVTLDWQTHEYLHRTRGAALANGFSISNYTIVGTGTADADAQFDLGGGTFFDEDLQVDIVSSNSPTPGTWQQDLAGPALIPVLYRSGTGWVRDTPTNFVLKAGTATPRYNTEAAGVWGLTDVPNNQYSTVWIIATNNLTYPVVAIMGQAADSNSGQVENIEWSALNLDGFPSVEFRPLYKIVFQCSSGYSNTIKARFTKVFDIRNLVAASPAATIGSAHSGLSGLGNDDHLQYLHVTEVRSPSAAVKASFLPPQASNAGKYLKTDGSVTSWETLTNPNNGTLTMSTSGTGISGSATFTADQAGSSTFTVTLNSSASNVVNTVVLRDGSGNFSGNVITANSFSGPLSGNASTASALATARTISSTGDVVWTTSFDGTGNVSGTANLSTTGVSSSTYGSATQVATFTVDTKGRITAASSVNIAPAWSSITGTPTSLAGYGITNGQPLDADLTAIAALTGTSGFLKKTATDTWTLDTSTYVPTNGAGATGTWGINVSGNANTATSANSATTATNVAGGVAGAVPYQSGAGTTAFSAAGTSGQYLQSNGTSAPTWVTPPTIGNGTLTMNVSGVGLSGSQTFTANQSSAATFTVTSNATSANTASTIVARDASGNFNAGQGRFSGWYTSGTGNAVEVGVSGGAGYVIAYDRTASAYTALNLQGGSMLVQLSGTTANVTGGALQQGGNQVLHAGNYTSYSPSLTGGGASGTWSINVTGNAATATTATNQSGGTISATSGTVSGVLTAPRHYIDRSGYAQSGISWYSAGYTAWADYMGPAGAGGLGPTGNISAPTGTYVTSWALRSFIENATGYGWTWESGSATGQPSIVAELRASDGTLKVGNAFINSNQVLHAGNYTSYSPSLTGSGASGTWGISISGSSRRIEFVDGPRNLSDRLPNTLARSVNWDFVSAGTGNGAGNYAGVMTFTPWDGTSASTGDSSYQLAFANQSGVNASGPARLSIRNGINSTWNAWQEILSSSNYTSYSPSLTGSGASGTWGISISGNAATATTAANYLPLAGGTMTGTIYTGSGFGSIIIGQQGGVTRGYLYNDSSGFGLLTSGGSWALRINYGTNETYMAGIATSESSFRAPIFYDSNNTAYYWDGASTSKWNESNQDGWHTFNNYGLGVTGTYDSYRLQTVFAMGAAYRMAADGSATSNMYGLAWSHPNAGSLGGANNLNDHGLLLINAGSFRAAISSRAVFTADVRGTLFYDYNNTGYYVDPASVSYLYGLTLAGGSYFRPNTWIQFDGSYGLYWPNHYGAHLHANDLSTYTQLALRGSKNSYGGFYDQYSGVNGFMYDSGGNGGIYRESTGRWFAYYSVGNDCWGFGTSSTASAYNLYAPKGLYSGGRVDGTIFYDSNNTGYYLDPTSTTSIRTAGSWRSDSGSWDGEFAGKIQYHSNNWYFQYTSNALFRNSGGSNVVTIDSSGNVSANGTVAASSDERLKTNWRDLPADFVEQLAKVKAGVYDRVDEEGMTQVGVSAQSLEPLMPHAVTHNADGMLGVAYGNAALVAAVKLAERVVELERRLAALESGEK